MNNSLSKLKSPQISKTSDDNEVVLSYVRGTCLRFAAALRIFGNPCASRVLQGLISPNGPGYIRDTYAAPPLFAQLVNLLLFVDRTPLDL
jgi:hypothetical protein